MTNPDSSRRDAGLTPMHPVSKVATCLAGCLGAIAVTSAGHRHFLVATVVLAVALILCIPLAVRVAGRIRFRYDLDQIRKGLR